MNTHFIQNTAIIVSNWETITGRKIMLMDW